MKVLCTMSGGSDSAYAAFVAKQHWPDAEFHSMFVNYGQPEHGAELTASINVHNKLKFPAWAWHDVRIQWLYDSLKNRNKNDHNSLYIPHRNLVIASAGAAMAADIGAEKLVVGNKSFRKTEGDFLTYDGNREFYKALEAVVRMIEVLEPKLQIVPTLSEFFETKLTRQDVYFGLWGNGFIYHDTFSCWFAEDDKECGTCSNCKEKLELWDKWREQRG